MDLIDKREYEPFFPDGGGAVDVLSAAERGEPLSGGHYTIAQARSNDIVIGRDPLGCHKLFAGFDARHNLIVANRLERIWNEGIKLADIASCPPGAVLAIRDRQARRISYDDILDIADAGATFDIDTFHAAVAERLEATFQGLARQFAGRRVIVTLSGGLDSSVIASFARRHFDDLIAASFSYLDDRDLAAAATGTGPGQWTSASEDFQSAVRVADALGLRLLPVVRPAAAVAATVEPAVRLGQDWRDFNVHCATVNLFLAEDIAAAFPGERAVVLTGDLMNEFVCDYREEVVDGRAYYRIPNIPLGRRRKYFVRGLDAGDREVGVMAASGLTVCQPFATLARHYLSVPPSILERPDAKSLLNDPLLAPAAAPHVRRAKTRAQVGGERQGTLGIYHRLGIGDEQLQGVWRGCFPGETAASCDGVIQFGRYRVIACEQSSAPTSCAASQG